MNKKVLAIVGLAAAVALSGGVITATVISDQKNKEKERDSAADTSITETADNISDTTESPISDVTEVTTEDVTEHILPTRQETTIEPTVPYEEQLVSADFSVQYAYDHASGEEISPRVVFGASYSYCYVHFDSDGSFEICLDPATGTVRTGVYHIYGNVVSVEYDSGAGAEYDIITDEEGNITYLIVNYGDYDVYFG